MTITQLNLANELNERIQKLKEQREKYKKAFNIVTKNIQFEKNVIIPVLNNENDNFSIEDEVQASSNNEDFYFPSEEFAEFLEHKIIKIDVLLEEAETKFKQL